MKFETRAIRIQSERSQHLEHSTPIFPTSSFVFESAEDMQGKFAGEVAGNIYSRFSNPSVREFELKMASLEGGEDCIATASGMSAIFTVMASLLSSGDHVVMSQAVFGSTIRAMDNFFTKWSIEVTYTNQDNNDWESYIKEKTKLVYIETPSNPGLSLINIEALSEVCKSKNTLLVVDNCFATPYLQQPLSLGADIVVHSATKFIDGQGRVLGGAIISSVDLVKEMIPFMKNAGPSLSPFNAWILSKSLETLCVRMDRHSSNALNLAEALSQHRRIKNVKYPHLESHPDYALALRQMKKGGGIVTFEIDGNLEDGQKFINNLEFISISANLGDTRSIATHPATSTHSKLSVEQRENVGISNEMIRISVGLEHHEDILGDVIYALK